MTDKPSISARIATGLHAIAKAGHDIANALRETGRTGEGQIDTQEPAEEPRGGSGDSGTSGGSCARCGAGITLPADDPENREMGVCMPCEIAVFKEGWQEARAQVERVQALAHRFDDDGQTGIARMVREAVAGDAAETNEEGA